MHCNVDPIADKFEVIWGTNKAVITFIHNSLSGTPNTWFPGLVIEAKAGDFYIQIKQ